MAGELSKYNEMQNQQALEPLDQEIADALIDRAPRSGPASILIVQPDGAARDDLVDLLEAHQHRCICIGRLSTAKATVARGRFDLILVNPDLPDGSGLELIDEVSKSSPFVKTIAISDRESFDDIQAAIRAGAVDFMRLPIEVDELTTSLDATLLKSRTERQRDERIIQLKKICKALNQARHQISDQVDMLCKDLVNVYQDMTEQVNEVALTSEYKTLLKQELDVEELLRTSLQYLLTKTNPTNAAVFLPDADEEYGLGAYVNYDCPRESISVLLDHLCQYICPQMSQETEITSFDDVKQFADWIDADVVFLEDTQIIAYACHHQGKCMAVIVLFRNKSEPFPEELAGTLDSMRGIFAEQLANIIKIHHRSQPSWPKEAWDDDADYDGDDYGFGYEGGLAA